MKSAVTDEFHHQPEKEEKETHRLTQLQQCKWCIMDNSTYAWPFATVLAFISGFPFHIVLLSKHQSAWYRIMFEHWVCIGRWLNDVKFPLPSLFLFVMWSGLSALFPAKSEVKVWNKSVWSHDRFWHLTCTCLVVLFRLMVATIFSWWIFQPTKDVHHQTNAHENQMIGFHRYAV